MRVFHLLDELLQLIDRDLLLFDQRGDGAQVGVVEVFADDPFQRARPELVVRHDGEIAVGVAECLVREIPLFLQPPNDGRQRIEMRLWIVVERQQLLYV